MQRISPYLAIGSVRNSARKAAEAQAAAEEGGIRKVLLWLDIILRTEDANGKS